jgi:hypothetical protein
MFDMLTGQYKNLASKGRYGDTMLAHVNPEEAALLKSRGGAGTINPKTGLPEFYNFGFGLPQREPEPEPVLAQVFQPNAFENIPDKLDTITVPQEGGFGRGGVRPAYEKIAPEFDQYADRGFATIMGGGGRPIEGYTVPTDKTFQDKPLVAKYDAKGNFIHLMVDPQNALTLDPNQPNILATPTFNKTGGITNYGVYDANEQGHGGFGDFIGDLISDFGPMILAGVTANLLGPAAGAAGGAAGGGAAALSPYAAQAAGAYGGSAAAAAAAAAGNLAGIAEAAAAQNALTQAALSGTGITYGQGVTPTAPSTPTPEAPATPTETPTTTPTTPTTPTTAPTPPVTPPVPPTGSGSPLSGVTPSAVTPAVTSAVPAAVTNAATAAAALPDLSSLGGVGTAILDFAKANPSIAGALLGAVTSAVSGAKAPTSTTTTSSIDPQIKAEYLANLERAKTTAAALEARQIAQPGQLYNDAERQLYNLGMTPFGEADIAKFFNPYENQVVQGALGDIERTRQMQEQANRDQATRARAFGGSRQAVVSGMTNEAALRQAANTSAQLRSAGFTQAANLGLQARPMNMAGLQTSLGLGTTRTALEQARLDALRNLGTERLGITSGALGLQPANVGGTTSQPLYNNTAGNLLSGGLTGAYIGSLLKG